MKANEEKGQTQGTESKAETEFISREFPHASFDLKARVLEIFHGGSDHDEETTID